MEPIARRYATRVDVSATQDFLSDKRDHDGVIDVVVGRVARSYVFKSELGDEADHAGIAGLQSSVSAIVHCPKFADKSFDDDLRRIEHSLTIQIFGKTFV